MQEMWVLSLGWEDPLEGKWHPTPVGLPGIFHGQRILADYSPMEWGCKESETTELLSMSCRSKFSAQMITCFRALPVSLQQNYPEARAPPGFSQQSLRLITLVSLQSGPSSCSESQAPKGVRAHHCLADNLLESPLLTEECQGSSQSATNATPVSSPPATVAPKLPARWPVLPPTTVSDILCLYTLQCAL